MDLIGHQWQTDNIVENSIHLKGRTAVKIEVVCFKVILSSGRKSTVIFPHQKFGIQIPGKGIKEVQNIFAMVLWILFASKLSHWE